MQKIFLLFFKHLGWSLLSFVGGLALCALLIMLCGCSTTRTETIEVPVVKVVHDTIAKVDHRTDSVYLKEWVYVSGDTVYMWRDRYRERQVHDTLLTVRTDTLTVTRTCTITKEVAAQIPWHKQALLWLGKAALAILSLLLGYSAFRIFIRR